VFGAGTGPGPATAIVTRLLLVCLPPPPRRLSLPRPPCPLRRSSFFIIAYGSRDTDTLGDERYGADDQRQLEIALRPKLPRRA
jgi:hypothetical protein